MAGRSRGGRHVRCCPVPDEAGQGGLCTGLRTGRRVRRLPRDAGEGAAGHRLHLLVLRQASAAHRGLPQHGLPRVCDTLIRSGALGDIVSGEISYCHGHPAPGQQRRLDEASAGAAAEETPAQEPQREPPSGRNPYEDGGGNYKRSSQCTHATHPWDLARYLLGEVREVSATSGPCDMGILWMHSGAICHVLAGTVRHASVGYMQRQIVAVNGRLGSGWLNREETPPYRWLATYKTDDDIQPCPQVSDLPESSHGATIRTKNLLDAIEGKAELICSLEDGATTTELLHALWLSQRLQVKVPVLPAGHTG